MDRIMLLSLKVAGQLKEEYADGLVDKPWIGLLSIATFLEFNGYETMVRDIFPDKKTMDGLVRQISEKQPVIAGISVFTENADKALLAARIIKSQFPGIKIVLGGPHASLCPMECIKSDSVDFVVLKEGEATMLEIAEMVSSGGRSINPKDIPGIVYKEGDKIILNEHRGLIADLDLLPIVKRELTDISGWRGIVNVSSSRGCSGRCIYCAATALSGAVYRVRDISNFYMEVLMLRLMLGDKMEQLFITDDTFTGIPERVLKFIDLLKKHRLDIRWRCESRIDKMSRELIGKMAENGCIGIQYGIESGSQEVLDKIGKNIDIGKALEVIEYTHDAGIFICLSFMIGHYCDTRETMGETLGLIERLFRKYKKIQLVLSYNTPFPGTWQYTRMNRLGMRLAADKYEDLNLAAPVVETRNFTLEDQKDIYRKAYPYLWYLEKEAHAGAAAGLPQKE